MNKKKTSKVLLIFVSLFSLIIGFVLGGAIYHFRNLPISDKVISGDLEIHFLELGNNNSGDSILIQIGEYDILVDAGSKTTSLDTIKSYLDVNVEDKTLEYVIVLTPMKITMQILQVMEQLAYLVIMKPRI